MLLEVFGTSCSHVKIDANKILRKKKVVFSYRMVLYVYVLWLQPFMVTVYSLSHS